jgi:hypothetical protein
MAWVIAAPFAVMSAVTCSAALRRLVERCYWFALAAGWSGFALVACGAALGARGTAAVALAVGAPLLGLCVWVRQEPGDGGGQPAPSPDLGDPPETIDWDRFMRDLAEWSAANDRPVERSGAQSPAAKY